MTATPAEHAPGSPVDSPEPDAFAPSPDDPRLERALKLLETGDNRAARALLRTIRDEDAPDTVKRVRDELLERLRPDRAALVVFALSLLLVLVVAVLALRHSAGIG